MLGLGLLVVITAGRVISVSEQEEKVYPSAVLKKTRSGRGIIIIIPDPLTGTSHTYITSKEYLEYLLAGTLRGGMLGANYLGEGSYEQFLNKEWRKKVNVIKTKSDNPLGYESSEKRKKLEMRNVDEW